MFSNAPVLQFPNYVRHFTLFTDVSSLGLETVLMLLDRRRKFEAVEYASRTVNQVKRK